MGKLLLTILGLIGVTIGLMFAVYFGLNVYTKHGQNQQVPNVKGKSFFEAKKELSKNNLDYIVVDSTYREDIPPLSIIDQQPRKGSLVKEGRKIYLTLNASQPPSVKIPNLIDNSRRQAELILNSWGLKVGNYIYIPDMAKDAVLGIQINGKEVKSGKVVKKGSSIDLVLGDGFGNQIVEVPPLTDLTVIEAIAVLDAVHLNRGMLLADGQITDTLAAYVYDQEPKYGLPGKLGPNNSVNLFIRQTKSMEEASSATGINTLQKK
ncbi:MAG: PASTA domain-containing protein [Chitinophagales bacterium]